MTGRFIQSNFCTLIILLLLGFAFSDLAARPKRKRQSPPWEIQMGIAAFYDNNILKYSDKYLDRFVNSQDEGRFHINRYDDLLISGFFNTSRDFRLFGPLQTTLETGIDYRRYSYNTIKNWSNWSVAIRQNLPGRMALKISYHYIPRFYVRHFRDQDWVKQFGYTPATFQPFEFAKDNFGIWLHRYLFRHSLLRFYFNWMGYFYNSHFTEFDSHNYLSGFTLYQGAGKTIQLKTGFRYIWSGAKGTDEPGEVKPLSNDADASYREEIYLIGLKWNPLKFRRRPIHFEIETRYYRRSYCSTHFVEADPLHAGRLDENFRLYLNLSIQPASSLEIRWFYNWFLRDSDSVSEINRTYIADEKDYRQTQTGVRLIYTLKFR